MMKYILMLCLIFNVAAADAQNDFNKLDSNGQKHGLWKGFFEESQRVKYEGTFDHGKEKGVFTFYDDTKAHTVVATRDFSKGNNSAYTTFYDPQKNVVSEGNIINKQYDGLWKYYHKGSKTLMTTETYKGGKLKGKRSVFYPDGKIAEEAQYKDGVMDGVYKRYAVSGKILEEGTYKNGELDGPAVYRDGNGNLVSKGNYVNGQKKGYWEFYENGKMTLREKYPIQRKTTNTAKSK
jgi:antitoxin component YwqK of YwqJK toxin-antitoxin module